MQKSVISSSKLLYYKMNISNSKKSLKLIISKTPYRISFFGGGTDYPEWYLKNDGEVISSTINKYVYLTCRYLPNFFDHKYRIVYSKIELARNSKDIEHKVVKKL